MWDKKIKGETKISRKRVTFSAVNDVVYIQSSAPVKNLLDNNYSKEQLERIKGKSNKKANFLPSILNKLHLHQSNDFNDVKSLKSSSDITDDITRIDVPGVIKDKVVSNTLSGIKYGELTQSNGKNSSRRTKVTSVVTADEYKNDTSSYKSSFPIYTGNSDNPDKNTIKDNTREDNSNSRLPCLHVSDVINGIIPKLKETEIKPNCCIPMPYISGKSILCVPQSRNYKMPPSQISTRYSITDPDLPSVLDLIEEGFEHTDKKDYSLPLLQDKFNTINITKPKVEGIRSLRMRRSSPVGAVARRKRKPVRSRTGQISKTSRKSDKKVQWEI